MVSPKKIKKFLDSAVNDNVVGEEVSRKLLGYLEEKEKGTGLGFFTQAISLIGFFAVLLGVILIISHNWHEISKSTKIISFLIFLFSSHAIAFYIELKDLPFKKTALSLHFLGGGLVIAGIGLYAQIYNLVSFDGKAYLIWFVMIFPLAYLLRNRPLSIMALFSFVVWIIVYTNYHMHYATREFIFMTVLVSSTIVIYFSAISRDEWLRGFVKSIGYGVMFFVFIWVGFLHESTYKSFVSSWRGGGNQLMAIHFIFIIFTVIGIAYLIYKDMAEGEDDKYFDTKENTMVLMALLVSAYPYFFDNLAVMSFMSWALWFTAALLLISKGSHEAQKKLVNWGVFLFAFGLFLRFVDLVSTMLKTGIAFIVFGILLIVFSLAIEKWRKSILKNMEAGGGHGA